MKRRRIATVLAVLLLLLLAGTAGCQLVFGYEGFDGIGAVDAGPPPHPCEVLPPVKVVVSGHGPPVSRVNLPGGSCVWIDQTEVTVEQYAEWLGDDAGRAPDWAGVGSESQCDWKTGKPSNPAGDSSDPCRNAIETLQQSREDGPFEATKPIRCVDWCDARGFCAWAGKRLCFGFNYSGLLNPVGKPAEWDLACSAGNTRAYPNGPTYDPRACNVDQSTQGCVASTGGNSLCGPTSVGSFAACRASRTAPSDLSGNVAEWIGLCTKQPGLARDAQCNRRGGSYLDPPDRALCAAFLPAARSARDRTTGFRCCADLTAQELTNVQTNGEP